MRRRYYEKEEVKQENCDNHSRGTAFFFYDCKEGNIQSGRENKPLLQDIAKGQSGLFCI